MPTIEQLLEEKVSQAITVATGSTRIAVTNRFASLALVQPTANPQFGDYQANGVMAAAKAHKMNPRELAQKVTALLNPAEVPASWEIAGPGFINFRLDPTWVGRTILAAANDEWLGIAPAVKP